MMEGLQAHSATLDASLKLGEGRAVHEMGFAPVMASDIDELLGHISLVEARLANVFAQLSNACERWNGCPMPDGSAGPGPNTPPPSGKRDKLGACLSRQSVYLDGIENRLRQLEGIL